MRFTDLLIVYFSIGAPVLVAYMVTKRCAATLSSVAYAVAVFGLWPFFAATLLYQKNGRKRGNGGFANDSIHLYTRNHEQIDIIRKRIEEIICSFVGSSEIYRWRSDFDRYVSVCQAVSDKPDSYGEFELIRVIQHPDPEIANACHHRRILRNLSLQLVSSRAELLLMTRRLCKEPDAPIDVEQLLLSLALLLDDRRGEADIRQMFESDEQNASLSNVSIVGNEVWQPQI